MRVWVIAPMLLLVAALPALAGPGAWPETCPNEHDPAKLADPAEELAALRAAGIDVAQVQPLGAVPLPVDVDLGQLLPGEEDNHPCTGKIRPGARLVFNNAWLCTANFIYRDEVGAWYVGTAGHCIPGMGSYTITVPGISGDIGDPAFTTGNGGVGNDFALIRIDPAFTSKIMTTMCHWGGPHDLGTGPELAGATVLLHYGWGNLWESTSVTRARAGVLPILGWTNGNSFSFEGLAGPGDSGSGIETVFGGALGVLTHGIQVAGVPLVVVIGMKVDRGLAMASAETGHTYYVQAGEQGVDLTGLFVP